MLCLVRYLFVISTSVIDCLGRFVPEMTYYVSSGTLNLAQLQLVQICLQCYKFMWIAVVIWTTEANTRLSTSCTDR